MYFLSGHSDEGVLCVCVCVIFFLYKKNLQLLHPKILCQKPHRPDAALLFERKTNQESYLEIMYVAFVIEGNVIKSLLLYCLYRQSFIALDI